jgi:hypothetical protein
LQQSIPVPQHWSPQQLFPVLHAASAVHRGLPHLPLSQKGLSPVHLAPHCPQLRMSFLGLTHTVPQHMRSWPVQFAQLPAVPPSRPAPVVAVPPVVPVPFVPVEPEELAVPLLPSVPIPAVVPSVVPPLLVSVLPAVAPPLDTSPEVPVEVADASGGPLVNASPPHDVVMMNEPKRPQ